MVTRRISFYWAQGEGAAPDLVRRCWQAWARMNPGWQVEIAGAAQAEAAFAAAGIAHPPATFQGQADIFRLHDIATRGGLYIDAATVPVRPLDDWLGDWTGQGFFAFHDPYRGRPVENWFLYADPGAPLALGWLAAMRRYWAVPRRPMTARRALDPGWKGALSCRLSGHRGPAAGAKQAVLEPRDRAWSVAPGGGARRPLHPYFWPHYLFQVMLDEDPALRAAWADVPKVPSYKELMLRHWKRRYAGMTAPEFDSLVAGSHMQKLALNTPPPEALLARILPPADAA